MARMVSKSEFKAKALEFFRQVQQTGEPVIVTDRKRPVVKVVPFHADPMASLKSLRNTVLRYEDPTSPVGLEDWEAAR